MGCTATTAQDPKQLTCDKFGDEAEATPEKQLSKRSMVANSDTIPRPSNEEHRRDWASTIMVTGAEKIRRECMGEFSLTDISSGSFHNWKPIYRNQNARFLFFCADLKLWIIGTSYLKSKGRISSSYDAETPEDSRYWKVWDDEKWSSDFEVSVTAKKKLAELATFVAQPGADIMEGDFVCVRGADKRGRVITIVDKDRVNIRLEGRSRTVATFPQAMLRSLPESLSGCPTQVPNPFSLPQPRI